MTVIDYATSMPEWFGTMLWITGGLAALSLILGIVLTKWYEDSGFLFIPALVISSGVIAVGIAWGDSSERHVPFEEKQRIAVEVSEVSGVEVGIEEIDLMLDEKPVRGVYYIKDGTTLVVEEKS